MSGFKTKMGWTLYLKIKQTSSVPQQFELKVSQSGMLRMKTKVEDAIKLLISPQMFAGGP